MTTNDFTSRFPPVVPGKTRIYSATGAKAMDIPTETLDQPSWNKIPGMTLRQELNRDRGHHYRVGMTFWSEEFVRARLEAAADKKDKEWQRFVREAERRLGRPLLKCHIKALKFVRDAAANTASSDRTKDPKVVAAMAMSGGWSTDASIWTPEGYEAAEKLEIVSEVMES